MPDNRDLDKYEHDNTGSVTFVISVVFTVLSAIFLALRMLTRYGIVRNFGPEDWLILVAFIMSVGLTATIGMEVHYGQGHHVDTISPENLIHILQALYASLPIYNLGLTFVKLSILFQYHRVFVFIGMRRAIYASGALVIAYGLFAVCANLFMCTPIAKFWDASIPGHCASQRAIWFSAAAINIVSDVIIFLLPMPALKSLNLPKRQKLGLMAVFALGIFVCLVSILRLHSLYVISVSKDATYDNGPAAYWSSIEVNVGIICASLPTLKAFVSRFFPRFFGSSNRNNAGALSSNTRRPTFTPFSKSTLRKQSTINPRTGTVTEVELADSKAWADTARLDPGRIQVVTLIEQEREELRDEDRESDSGSDSGRRGAPSVVVTGGGAWLDDHKRPGSKGDDMA